MSKRKKKPEPARAEKPFRYPYEIEAIPDCDDVDQTATYSYGCGCVMRSIYDNAWLDGMRWAFRHIDEGQSEGVTEPVRAWPQPESPVNRRLWP